MPSGLRTSRAQVWADNLGDWTWPGQAVAATVEALPPAWVPARPPRLERAGASGAARTPSTRAARRERARTLLIGVLLSALVAVCAGLVVQGRARSAQQQQQQQGASADRAASVAGSAAHAQADVLPALKPIGTAASGSAIEKAAYASVALHGGGSFYVYLPPGYSSASAGASSGRRGGHAAVRYPVLYLLHGNSQPATAFLHVGLQSTLDRLTAEHLVPPMIAVMIEGAPGSNNWRNIHSRHFESYVLEVQAMVDRMLPTIAARDARAVAGDSMGGFGAMNLALHNPARFGVVESWIGFFNGLEDQLRLDRPIIAKLGLHAFVYGAAQDTIADPSENAPFAAELRAAGADAHSAVYPGEHSLATVEAHLSRMLHFAGRWLARSVTEPSESAAGSRSRS